jgi:hypothetical protein
MITNVKLYKIYDYIATIEYRYTYNVLFFRNSINSLDSMMNDAKRADLIVLIINTEDD